MKSKKITNFRKTLFTIDLEKKIVNFSDENLGIKNNSMGIKEFLFKINDSSYVSPFDKTIPDDQEKFINENIFIKKDQEKDEFSLDSGSLVQFINYNNNVILFFSHKIIFFQLKINYINFEKIEIDVVYLVYKIKTKKINKDIFTSLNKIKLMEYDNKIKDLTERYKYGAYIFIDLIDDRYFKNYGFILFNVLLLNIELQKEIVDYLITEDNRVILLFKDQNKLLKLSQEIHFFLSENLNFNFLINKIVGYFSNYDFDKKLKLSLIEYLYTFKIKKIQSKHFILKIYNEIETQTKILTQDIKNLKIVKTSSKNRKDRLEISIDLKKELLTNLFLVGPTLLNKIFLKLITEANKEANDSPDIKWIIISLPFWFLVFIDDTIFVDKKIIFNFNFQDLNYFNVDNIKNIFIPLKISNLKNQFNISLEYDKDKTISKKTQEFNIKNVSFREELLNLPENENNIEKDLLFFNVKKKEFEQFIFWI